MLPVEVVCIPSCSDVRINVTPQQPHTLGEIYPGVLWTGGRHVQFGNSYIGRSTRLQLAKLISKYEGQPLGLVASHDLSRQLHAVKPTPRDGWFFMCLLLISSKIC